MALSERAKLARREYARRYREKHREKIREYERQWRMENPEKVKANFERYWLKKADEYEMEEKEKDE